MLLNHFTLVLKAQWTWQCQTQHCTTSQPEVYFAFLCFHGCRNQDEVLDMEKKEHHVAGCCSLPDVTKATADEGNILDEKTTVPLIQTVSVGSPGFIACGN